MEITTAVPADQQLDHLARLFAQWRQSRAYAAERIPQPLWEQAMALAATLPPARVAKQVGVRAIDLKRRMGLAEAAPLAVVPRPVTFVEVPPAPLGPPPTAPAQLELSRADGMRLSLHGPAATLPLAAIVQAFLEGHLCCK